MTYRRADKAAYVSYRAIMLNKLTSRPDFVAVRSRLLCASQDPASIWLFSRIMLARLLLSGLGVSLRDFIWWTASEPETFRADELANLVGLLFPVASILGDKAAIGISACILKALSLPSISSCSKSVIFMHKSSSYVDWLSPSPGSTVWLPEAAQPWYSWECAA